MASPQLQNIALGLQGLGAGLQGQLPQFTQGLQQQQLVNAQQEKLQQEMETERQRTLFTAAQTALNLLEDDNFDGLIQFGGQRIQVLQAMGGDPSDTQRLTQLAMAARNGSDEAKDLLKNELEAAVEIGRGMGILETEEPDLEIMQLFPAGGGEPMTIQADGKGNFRDMEGTPIQLHRGDRLVEGSNLSGSTDDLGVTGGEMVKLREAEISTQNFVDTVGDALTMLEESPDINTFAARGAAFVNNLQQEANALAGAMGIEVDPDLINPDEYEGTFDELGIENARMRSMITSLAYSQAIANNPDGRISNADLSRAIDEIGGSAADPRAFRQVLLDVANRTVRAYQNRHKIVAEEDFANDFGLGEYQEPAGGAQIPEGATATNPQTGERKQFINGQWVPL